MKNTSKTSAWIRQGLALLLVVTMLGGGLLPGSVYAAEDETEPTVETTASDTTVPETTEPETTEPTATESEETTAPTETQPQEENANYGIMLLADDSAATLVTEGISNQYFYISGTHSGLGVSNTIVTDGSYKKLQGSESAKSTAWKFVVVDAAAGKYYIQDEKGKYLNFCGGSGTSGRDVSLSDTPVETLVYSYNGSYIFAQNGDVTLNRLGGTSTDTNFCGWGNGVTNLTNAGNRFTLTPVCDETLGGKSYYIIGVSSSLAVSDNIVAAEHASRDYGYDGIKLDATEFKKYRLNASDELKGATKWTFGESGIPGAYYIKSDSGKYLTFTTNAVEVTDKSNAGLTYVFTRDDGTYVLNQGAYFLNLYGGTSYSEFTGYDYRTDAGSWFYIVDNEKIGNEWKYVQASAENVKMTVFNYSSAINTAVSGMGYMPFNQNANWEPSVDGTAKNDKGTGTAQMKDTLVNSYPEIKTAYGGQTAGSLKYLFNGNYPGTTAYQVSNSDGSGTGLFQYIDDPSSADYGYFVYDSGVNAAYFDQSTGKFELYDYVVRPAHFGYTDSDIEVGNFLPFNQGHTQGVEDYRTDNTLEYVAKSDDSRPNAYRLLGTKESNYTDLWFGMQMEFDFNMPAGGQVDGRDMIFDFHGDDDVWIYIDDVLILDIGGTHAARSGTINFATGEVSNPENAGGLQFNGTLYERFLDVKGAEWCEGKFQDVNGDGTPDTFKDWESLNLKFYYMERGGNISYCRLRFNMVPIPDNTLLVGKELTIDEDATSDVKDFLEANLTYKFRVWSTDKNGNKDEILFAGQTFKILENGADTGKTGTVGADGVFELKAGQHAEFDDILSTYKDLDNYIVEELIEKDLAGQYGDIEYSVSGGTSTDVTMKTPKQDSTIPEGYLAYISTPIEINEEENNSAVVNYNNQINVDQLSILKITKKVSAGSEDPGDDPFPIQVKLDGVLLPVGTQYTVGSETKTVETAGIINLKAGETAVLVKGIVSGTKYEISEQSVTGWNPAYSGTVSYKEDGEEKTTSLTVQDGAITGQFPLNSTVSAIVTNSSYDFSCEVPISKTLVGNPEDENVTFNFEVIQGSDSYPGESITVTNSDKTPGSIVIGFKSTDADRDYTFQIKETAVSGDSIIYDGSVYDVTITVSTDASGQKTAEVTSITKGGTTYDSADFVNYKTVDLSVAKYIFGNMGDQSKKFPFTVSWELGDMSDTETFELAHGQTDTVVMIPYGAKVTVTETDNGGYSKTEVKYGSDEKNALTYTIDSLTVSGTTVEFTNTHNVSIETGIALDSLPYILILVGVVAVGAVLVVRKRRKYED